MHAITETLIVAQFARFVEFSGDLSLVADGFRCKRCDGSIQEADLAGP